MGFEFIFELKDQIIAFMRDNPGFAAPLVFALGLAESIALISLFVPSTVLFLAIGALHHAAGGSFVEVWLAGAAGAFLGDLGSYAIGWYFRDDIHRVWPFSRRPEWLDAAKAFFRKWGAFGIIGSKFLGMLRPFVPVVAGAVHMPRPVFVLASAISALIWAGVFLSPGFGIALLSG